MEIFMFITDPMSMVTEGVEERIEYRQLIRTNLRQRALILIQRRLLKETCSEIMYLDDKDE
jgi:hypothetical protein